MLMSLLLLWLVLSLPYIRDIVIVVGCIIMGFRVVLIVIVGDVVVSMIVNMVDSNSCWCVYLCIYTCGVVDAVVVGYVVVSSTSCMLIVFLYTLVLVLVFRCH